jgi:acyl carrier protein
MPGNKRLIAYVITDPNAASTFGELRHWLKEQLPDYMLPSAFVFLEALPLTPNGKVDREVLPPPDTSRPELSSTFVAPRTPIEETLAEIWTELLNLERVGIYDSFFDLGGHSLLAIQLISRVRGVLDVELPLRTLFEDPTVAGQALTVTQILIERDDKKETAQIVEEVKRLSGEALKTALSHELVSTGKAAE